MMARLAAFVVVIAVAAGAWFTVGPGAGPPIGACGPPMAALVASAEEGPEPPAFSVRWTAGKLPDGDERTFHDVVEHQGRFVAIGRQSRGPEGHAFVLRSTDGVTWEGRPDDEARFRGSELGEVVVVDERLFALGSVSTNDRGGSRAAVWISDDSVSWREARGPFDEASVSSLIAGDDGMLLIGSSNMNGVVRAWRSESGGAWEAASLELPAPTDVAHLGPIAGIGDGWLSVGSISRGPDSPAAPVVWRSGDGLSWTCHLLDAAGWAVARGHELHRSGASWLAVGGAGQVCGFGGSCPGYPIAWASDGGLTWGPAILREEPISLGGTAYAASDAGFVAVRDQATWMSASGETWIRIPDGGTGAALAGRADRLVLTDDGRILAAGAGWIAVGELSP